MDTNTQPIKIPNQLTITPVTLGSYLQDNLEKYLKVYLSKSEFSGSQIVGINYISHDYLEIKLILKGRNFIETRAYLYFYRYDNLTYGLQWFHGKPWRENIVKWWEKYDGICGVEYKDYITADGTHVHAPDYTKANEAYVIRILYGIHIMLKEIYKRYDTDSSFRRDCRNTTVTNNAGHGQQLIASIKPNNGTFYEDGVAIEFADNWW